MWPFTGERVLFLYDVVDCTGDEIYARFIHGTIDPVLCVVVDCLGEGYACSFTEQYILFFVSLLTA